MSSEWDKTLLGELIKHKKGFAFKSKDYIDAGTPVIRVSNFTDDSISPSDLKFVDQSVAALNKDVELQEYDIVIATVGSWPNNPASVVGRSISVPSWASGALMNQNAVVLRAKTNNPVDQRFLYFQTKSDEFSRHVVSKAQGSANQASITLDAIFSFPIFWPEYFARKEISNFLSAIDDRINLLRETNATLEAIAQALFKSWFVDFDPVHANAGTQAPSLPPEIQALFPATFTDSPQGPIPEGWTVSCLSEICQIASGKRPEIRSDVECEGTKVPLYGGAGVMGYTDKSLFDVKKILTGRVGTLGKVHIATPPFWASDNVLVLTPKDQSNFYFSLNWLLAIDVHSLNRGSTQPLLTQKDLGAQQRALPSKEILNEFEYVVAELYLKIQANSQQAQSLADLRDTLLPRLISGQLRLPEAEQAIASITD